MVKEDIETVIDRLYDFVNANKNTTVKDAAQVLSLPEEQVEKLAFLLEDSELIEVRYSLTGATLVSKTKLQPNAVSEEEAKETAVGKAGLLEEQVENAEGIAEFMEKDLMRRLKDAEANLKALESQKVISPDQVQTLEKEMEFISQRLLSFEEAIKKIEVRGGGLSEEVEVFQKRLRILEKTKIEKPLMDRLIEMLVLYIVFLRSMLGLKAKELESVIPKLALKKEAEKKVPQKIEEKAPEKQEPKVKVSAPEKMEEPKPAAEPAKPSISFTIPHVRLPKIEIEFVANPEKPKEAELTEIARPEEKTPLKMPELKTPKFKLPKVKLEFLGKGKGKKIKTKAKLKPKPSQMKVIPAAIKTLKGFKRVSIKRKDEIKQHYWKKGKDGKKYFAKVEEKLRERMLKQQFPWVKVKKPGRKK
ncbi:MAG: hypothetical protein V1717_00550 [Candidatus Micrarchaeota archaeon]